MLEVLTYKKYKQYKKKKEQREANAKQALDKQDEDFIRKSLDTPDMSQKSIFSKLLNKRKSFGLSVPLTDEEIAAIKENNDGLYL